MRRAEERVAVGERFELMQNWMVLRAFRQLHRMVRRRFWGDACATLRARGDIEGSQDSLRVTRDDSVLRGHDLPLPCALEPRVRPDLATLCLLAIVVLDHPVFRSIRYGYGVAEESDLHLAELAVARQRLCIRGDSFLLAVALALCRCPLKVVCNNVLKIRLRATG